MLINLAKLRTRCATLELDPVRVLEAVLGALPPPLPVLQVELAPPAPAAPPAAPPAPKNRAAPNGAPPSPPVPRTPPRPRLAPSWRT